MQLTLFWIFSLLMIGFGAGVVVLRNPVACALSLVASFLALAALFVTLDAYFIAIIQVLVTAGAVMVLFLFIIMLLDVNKDTSDLLKDKITLGASITGFTLLVILTLSVFTGGQHLPETALLPVMENPTGEGVGIPFTTSAKSYGYSLFTKYMLPFQVTGFLLLAAMIGVIVVSKKHSENS